jgi:hypothetical protein
MANNVRYTIDFHQINEAALTKLTEICARVREPEGYGDQWFGDMFVDGKEGSPTYDDTNHVSWCYENVGSKWCVVESMEIENNWALIAGYGGWNQPEEGTQWLMKQLAEVDENLIGSLVYDDEMPNFYGVSVYDGDEVYYTEQWDEDELAELVAEKKEEDDDEDNILWEVMRDHQHDVLRETVEELKADREAFASE